MPIKKIILILITILFLFALTGNYSLAQQDCTSDNDCKSGRKCVEIEGKKQCRKPLEVVYPKIPGVPTIETIDAPLPAYAVYIFRLAVTIIGFIILGSLVYAGVSYFLSFGNPAKLIDAKEGILAAFLGGIILLAAFIIFNTINPQLTIITPEDPSLLFGVAIPGVYLCNYDVTAGGYLNSLGYSDLNQLFNDYIAKDNFNTKEEQERQIKATKALGKLIYKDSSQQCQRISTSTNLRESFLPDYTMFAVPKVIVVNDPSQQKTVREPVYEYAIILYEGDDFTGEGEVYPHVVQLSGGKMLYNQFNVLPEEFFKAGKRLADTMGSASSVILLQKPDPDPGDQGGIAAYSCYDWENKVCPEDVEYETRTFSTGGYDIRIIGKEELGSLVRNIRSIRIRPENDYIAWIWAPDDHQDYDKSWIINQNRNNLSFTELCSIYADGEGHNSCTGFLGGFWNFLMLRKNECRPCISRIVIIKGTVK